MHEYSIVQALLERVQREAEAQEASRVHRIQVRIGELSGVEIDLLQAAFQVFRDRTICADADLDIQPVPARWICRRCERNIASGEILACPQCSLPAQLAQGDEIVLERIEMEVT